jgi:molybdopterin synthase catalytic subunit
VVSITVRYFAAARELAGRSDEAIALPQGDPTIGDASALLAARHVALAPYLSRMRFAVNGEFAALSTRVHDGDELVLVPPVAGGSDSVSLVAIRDTPLSIDEVVAAVRHRGAGGICVFLGIVRDHAEGKPVARLEYEAYVELATKETRAIADAIVREHPDVRLALVHRVGSLEVADVAVIAAASAPHRADAFAACRALIDRVKETVPIWKKEWGPDGHAHWVNLEG